MYGAVRRCAPEDCITTSGLTVPDLALFESRRGGHKATLIRLRLLVFTQPSAILNVYIYDACDIDMQLNGECVYIDLYLFVSC